MPGTSVDASRLARAREALARAELRAGLHPQARLVEAASLPAAVTSPSPVPSQGPASPTPLGHVLQVDGGRGPLLRAAGSLCADGRWLGVVAVPDVGWLAASRSGIDLGRVVSVPDPGPLVADVAALLLDGVDVLCLGEVDVPTAQRRRLAARVRRDGRVLLTTRAWPGISRPWHSARLRRLEAV